MICAIPARGGSKRLPRKNVKPLAGKPMIAYSIDAARQTGLFDEIYVCTEDREIADIALRYGAVVPELVSESLCGDLIPSHVPCQFLASELSKKGYSFDTLLCLQPSSPLRSPEDICSCIAHYEVGEFDFLVSVTPVDPHYFHWAVVPGTEPYWKMYFGTQFMKERPLLPPVARPNGSIKIARLDALSRLGNFFGERLGVVETPEIRSVHVATEFDFILCEAILNGMREPLTAAGS